ncbi:PE-PPE domain-containing protein [Mycolicibacter minnesotensis]
MLDAVAVRRSAPVPGLRAAFAATLVAGLTGVAPLTSSPTILDHSGVLLSSVDSRALSGSEIALIMGPSMLPTPSMHYAQTVDTLFLQPRGFAGELEVLTTPQEAYLLDASMAQGAKLLVDRIQALIDDGRVDAENPVTVFGYSQSAALTTLAMQQLNDADVSSDMVRFVLIGNSANPNGGLLVSFDQMPQIVESMAESGVTLGNPTPNALYPTDIYTLEYDGFADFPRYPLNFLSSLNAIMGMATQHIAYLGLTPEQIAGATLLESSPDSMVNSYVISSEHLPLLWPLLFIPVTGKPLYDLMEPTMRILVNLGYGSIENGWNSGPADVPTAASVDPQQIDWMEVSAALGVAAKSGWDAFVADIFDPSTYIVTETVDNPALDFLLAAGAGAGLAAGENASVQDLLANVTEMMWNSLFGQYLEPGYWDNVA